MFSSLVLIALPLDSTALLYCFLFGLLILSGIGLPMPEELILFLGGYLAYLEFVGFKQVLIILTLGIVVADAGGYFLGRYMGDWMFRKAEKKKFFAFCLERCKYYFEKYGEKVVLFSRPIIGVRVVVPILAGHPRMHFRKFLMYDILGAIPWTIFLVSLSYYLGIGFEAIPLVRGIKYGVFIIAILAVAVFFGVKFSKRKNIVR